MIERRASFRRAMFIPATIVFEGTAEIHNCLINNASDGGIQIELEILESMPEAAFSPLNVTLTLNTGQTLQGVRRWKEGTTLGIQLLDPLPIADLPL